MKNLALKHIQKIKAYCPPIENRAAYPGILLDFNERTSAPSPKVAKAIKKFIKHRRLQLYPEYGKITAQIASYAGVSSENILITNGSDQAIEIIFKTYTDKNEAVIIPSPSFAMFYQCANLQNNELIEVLYEPDLSFPLTAVKKILDQKPIKMVVICNPNNPTGTLVPEADIAAMITDYPDTVFLIDEVYFEFTKQTAVPHIKSHPNLLIIRSLSKGFGIPSLRFGYIVSHHQNIQELLKVRGPYDINMLSCAAAEAALSDLNNLKAYVKEVMAHAKPMLESFFKENKIFYYPSAANFILFKPEDPEMVFDILLKNGFRIRPRQSPNGKTLLRVSIGTVKEMKQFIKIYQKKILNK